MITRVQGNKLRISVPLELVTLTSGGRVVTDYEPQAGDVVAVWLRGSKSYRYTPTIEGNVLRWEDNGELWCGCYDLEVRITQADGTKLRAYHTSVLSVVNETSVVTDDDTSDFLAEGAELDAAFFEMAKGDPGTTSWEDITDKPELYTKDEADTLLAGKAEKNGSTAEEFSASKVHIGAWDLSTNPQSGLLFHSKAVGSATLPLPTDVGGSPNKTIAYTDQIPDVSGKADAATVNAALAGKADKSDTYTKEQTDALIPDISGKADASDVTALAGRVTTAEGQIATKQDELVSGTNIKTVNGQPLLGSGNIALRSYIDNSGEASVVLTVNQYHDLGTLTTWPTLTLPASYDRGEEFVFRFVCGVANLSPVLPAGIVLADGFDFSEIALGVVFQVSIMDNVAAYLCVTPNS